MFHLVYTINLFTFAVVFEYKVNEHVKLSKKKTMEKENEMTAERSLKIIRESIERSRRETTHNVGKSLLMWGVLVLVTSMVIGWLLWQTGNAQWQYLWFVFGIVGGLGQCLICRNAEIQVKNITSEMVGNIWISFAVCCICTFIIATLSQCIRLWVGLNGAETVLPIAPMILMMEALCATIMGLVLRNAWITATAILSGILSTAVAIALPDVRSMLAVAFAAMLNLIVPGLIIVLRKKKNEGGSALCSNR